MELRQETQLAHSKAAKVLPIYCYRRDYTRGLGLNQVGVYNLVPNRGLHTSCQYSTRNRKWGSDKRKGNESYYTLLPQSLLYKG